MTAPGKVVKTKLFIGNLDQRTQAEELNELFAPYGAVLEASVIKDYGFVHYGSIEEAEKAVAALNNKEFHGKRLRVELSTSTVRHRPGQPEPASALKHSRARAGVKGNSNGVSRYNSGTSGGGGGGGPMRHNPSSWARQDARPYDNIPYNHGAYDRARPYDNRQDSRRYYDEQQQHDNGYPPEYDMPGYGSNNGGPMGQRHYRDLPPHPRPDSYPSNRPYDHPDMPPVDPYYTGGLPPGPPTNIDPYQNYDPYPKYYSNRPREPEYPGPRDYDPYPNYRNDSYGMSNSNQHVRRHQSSADMRSPEGVYPPPHRSQHPTYPPGSSNYPPYYGMHQR